MPVMRSRYSVRDATTLGDLSVQDSKGILRYSQ